MATSSNFREWIGELDLEDYETIVDLYASVENRRDQGEFSCTTNGEKCFIKSEESETTLSLLSEKAREAFLKYLNDEKGGEFQSVSLQWDFIRMMRKDD